jgi:hypothetical protein
MRCTYNNLKSFLAQWSVVQVLDPREKTEVAL